MTYIYNKHFYNHQQRTIRLFKQASNYGDSHGYADQAFMTQPTNNKLNQLVTEARHASDQRQRGYRERALKMYPHICGCCTREFDRSNLHELTVHHRDHDHDHNPEDGSNWELLCLYCHDNEHQRQVEA